MPIVTATNIRVTLGAKQVLDGATIAIEPGERVGLVGRNGCGKTTLDRKSTRLNSSHVSESRMPSSA